MSPVLIFDDGHERLKDMATWAHLFWKVEMKPGSARHHWVFDADGTATHQFDSERVHDAVAENYSFEEDDPALCVLIEPASPVRDLLPVLAANALLTVWPEPATSGVSVPRVGRIAHYEGPDGQPLGYLDEDQARWWVAKWQLEIEGWRWDRDNAEAVSAKSRGRGRPPTLRNHAVSVLRDAWVNLEDEARSIRHARESLSWFFLPEKLTRSVIRSRLYRSNN